MSFFYAHLFINMIIRGSLVHLNTDSLVMDKTIAKMFQDITKG